VEDLGPAGQPRPWQTTRSPVPMRDRIGTPSSGYRTVGCSA
jgi:hypothetical protein